jgi:osmotically-inducible protein OsmY
MFGKQGPSDKELLKTVNRKLDRAGGGSQSRVSAAVRQGTVTLSGSIQYENQRTPIVKAASSVAGVRNVVDQLIGPSRNMRPTT